MAIARPVSAEEARDVGWPYLPSVNMRLKTAPALAMNAGHANVRRDFSRSHWRVFAAAVNASMSLASTTPAS